MTMRGHKYFKKLSNNELVDNLFLNLVVKINLFNLTSLLFRLN